MKFLASSWKRWLTWFLLASLFATACVFLARWQFDRRQEVVAKIERVYLNYDKPPVEFSEIPTVESVADLEWLPVKLKGEYLASKQLLVRNRPVAGQPGFVQLVPFHLIDGSYVLIERGWIAADSNLEPAAEFIPSSKTKTIVARLRIGELSPNRQSPDGQVTSIKLDELATLLGVPIEENYYLRLTSENPAEASYPQPLAKPILDEGNHLSYAIQWLLFAIMGFIALFWAIKQEREFATNGKNPEVSRNRRIKPTDADIEDEILDSR